MSKASPPKLTRTHWASVPSLLRYVIVATMVVVGVPVRGETSGSERRFGPLAAETGRATVPSSRAAAARARIHARASCLPDRLLLASNSL